MISDVLAPEGWVCCSFKIEKQASSVCNVCHSMSCISDHCQASHDVTGNTEAFHTHCLTLIPSSLGSRYSLGYSHSTKNLADISKASQTIETKSAYWYPPPMITGPSSLSEAVHLHLVHLLLARGKSLPRSSLPTFYVAIKWSP